MVAAAPIVTRSGTYRTATAAQTRNRIRPLLDRFGITRVADITGLDEVGLPVHVAYRPCGSTLSVSIGIGLEPTQAWVGAVMESIEIWHAENARLTVAARGSAGDLDLPYDVQLLPLARNSLLTAGTVLDWVEGRGILSGRPLLVPYEAVRLDFTRRMQWGEVLFDGSSNGMATGNTLAEATLHGLLEVMERDACAPHLGVPLADRRYVDPASTDHPVALAVLSALRAAGCTVEICETTNDLGVPTYACSLWSPDLPLYFPGFGCHLESGLAVARAMFEAALSRLTIVSGARDDIDEDFYANAPAIAGPTVRRELRPVADSVGPVDSMESVIRFCAEQIQRVTGSEPIVVDMSHEDIGIAASRVLAPGLRMLDTRDMVGRPGERHG